MKPRPGMLPAHLPPGDPVATDARHIKLARAWLARTGFTGWLDEALTAPTGRPRRLAPTAALTLIVVHALAGGDMVLSDVARRAAWLKPRHWQALALPARFSYDNLTATFRALAAALVPLEDPARLNPVTGELAPGHWIDMGLAEFTTRLLAASIPPTWPASPDQALDSTDHPTYARPAPTLTDTALAGAENLADGQAGSSQRRPVVSADRDARWGWRSQKNATATGHFLGYDTHLLVDVAPAGSPERPALARAIALAPAGSSKTVAGLDALDAYATVQGHYPHVLLADRGYSYALAENWALPLKTRRIQQVFDLHKTQRVALPDPARGCVWICGWPYALTMPRTLWRDADDQPRRFPSPIGPMTHEQRTSIEALYDALAPWAFRHHSYNPATGLRRFKAPILRCPAHPATLQLDYVHPTTECTPGHCACPPATISAGPEWLGREQQRHPYGTAPWRADYSRRVAVESFNAELKTNRARLRRATIRVLGLPKNAILLAAYAGAVNPHDPRPLRPPPRPGRPRPARPAATRSPTPPPQTRPPPPPRHSRDQGTHPLLTDTGHPATQ